MPAVTRIGDADIPHCSGMTRAVGSSNVFVNGIAVSRQSDINTVHKNPQHHVHLMQHQLHQVHLQLRLMDWVVVELVTVLVVALLLLLEVLMFLLEDKNG